MDLYISVVFGCQMACIHILLYEWGIMLLFYKNRWNAFYTFHFYSPRFKPWAIKMKRYRCNGFIHFPHLWLSDDMCPYCMNVAYCFCIIKTVETVFLHFVYIAHGLNRGLYKCNDIDAMDLSISVLVVRWNVSTLYEWGILFLYY